MDAVLSAVIVVLLVVVVVAGAVMATGNVREGVAELVRQAYAMSRREAALDSLVSAVLIVVTMAALFAGPWDLLVVGASLVMLPVGVAGLGSTLYRLLHPTPP